MPEYRLQKARAVYQDKPTDAERLDADAEAFLQSERKRHREEQDAAWRMLGTSGGVLRKCEEWLRRKFECDREHQHALMVESRRLQDIRMEDDESSAP